MFIFMMFTNYNCMCMYVVGCGFSGFSGFSSKCKIQIPPFTIGMKKSDMQRKFKIRIKSYYVYVYVYVYVFVYVHVYFHDVY